MDDPAHPVPVPRMTPEPMPIGGPHPGPVAISVATDPDGRRHAYFEPASSGKGRRRRLNGSQAVAVSDLQRLSVEARLVESHTRAAVHHARELGVSWALIGFSVGLTENGARGRFGEPDDGVVEVDLSDLRDLL